MSSLGGRPSGGPSTLSTARIARVSALFRPPLIATTVHFRVCELSLRTEHEFSVSAPCHVSQTVAFEIDCVRETSVSARAVPCLPYLIQATKPQVRTPQGNNNGRRRVRTWPGRAQLESCWTRDEVSHRGTNEGFSRPPRDHRAPYALAMSSLATSRSKMVHDDDRNLTTRKGQNKTKKKKKAQGPKQRSTSQSVSERVRVADSVSASGATCRLSRPRVWEWRRRWR